MHSVILNRNFRCTISGKDLNCYIKQKICKRKERETDDSSEPGWVISANV